MSVSFGRAGLGLGRTGLGLELRGLDYSSGVVSLIQWSEVQLDESNLCVQYVQLLVITLFI